MLRRRFLPFAVWVAGVAAAALVAWRAHYVADLSAFLPSAPTPEQQALLDPLQDGAAARLLLIGIRGGDAAARADASRRLAAALRESGAFASVDNGDSAAYREGGAFVFEHRYLLSPAVEPRRFTAAGLREAIDGSVALLGTPAGALIKPILLRDPTGETLRIAEALTPAHAPKNEGGVWVSRREPRALLVATTRAEGGDLDGLAAALDGVRGRFARLVTATPLTLELSGAPVFAVEARARIKGESERLALMGTVAIVGLLALAFASLRALVCGLLPVASGVLAGIACTQLVFGQVHGMTLGFGTTMIGEAVDYAIYYLVQAHAGAAATPGSGPARWVRESWPTVRLGLATSVIGFGALVFAGFPGLAQLGVFSVAGLIAGALTTRHVFPVIVPDGAPGTRLRDRLGAAMARAAAWLPRLRWPLALLAAAGLIALLVSPSPWRGQLTDLSPVSAAALARDASLRDDLGAPDAGTLVVISAPTEQGVLAAAERAGTRLDAIVAKGQLDGYASPARFLPSDRLQRLRLAALPDAATLRARLAEATADGPLPAARLDAFVADVAAARALAPVTRASLAGTPLAPALDALLVAGTASKPWRAFLNLQPAPGNPVDLALIRRAMADVPGARVVAIKGELDGLYARYLGRAVWQAGLGALAVVALLAWSLRSPRRLAGVLWPLAASVLLVLGALAGARASLGILHVVGFLLVIAIGSNYALFFDQLRHGDAPAPEDAGAARTRLDTLASLLLANLTIVVSFAILASSTIPVLHAIGIVVAPGTLLCLVLSAAFVGASRPAALAAHGRISAP